MEQKFLICKRCGNIVAVVKESGKPIACCGEPMQQLIPGTTDAAREKHVPVVEKDGNKVRVFVCGVTHPMADEHYIEWVSLQTKNGTYSRRLSPSESPEATFVLSDGDEPIIAYAYCNLHGLWSAEI